MLRPYVDVAYKWADRLRDKAISRLEEMLSNFNDECAELLAKRDGVRNEKRKFFPISQERNDGPGRRVFNTHHTR